MDIDIDWLSDGDDDVEIIAYINAPRRLPRQIFGRSNLYTTLTEEQFKRRFRIRKSTAASLLQQIEPFLLRDTDRNNAVTPMNQLLYTLRFYATGSQLITYGDVIGAHESTACRIVHRVTHAIALMYKEYIKFPVTQNEQYRVASGFYKIAKFPRVIGAVDCTHVKIISPGGDDAEIYRCRKGYFSINVQGIVDANLSFLHIVAGKQGSAHDSNIWDNCSAKRYFVQGTTNDKLILGDSGYAQTHYMMTPLPEGRVQTRGQRLYQESQIKSRNVVERAFGVWKRRFPILSRGINLHLYRVPGIIVACGILHNIAILHGDEVPPVEDEYPVLIYPEDNDALPGGQRRQRGNEARNLLIENYFSRL